MPYFHRLTPYPKTRINDLFASDNTSFNFEIPPKDYKHELIKGKSNDPKYRHICDFYSKIGLDIVTETALEYPYAFITEKTYRPILNGRPFIIIGPAHSLKFLKSLGFKTFSNIINESYDEVTEPEERLQKCCESITEFVDRPIEEIQEDICNISDILTHNQTQLSNVYNQQLNNISKIIEDYD